MPQEGQIVDEETKLRALSTICLSLEKINYSLVMDAKDAKDAWDKLKVAFQDDGIYRRIGLLQQLTSFRLDNFNSTEAYVDAVMSTSHKLAEINFAVSDEWLASILLMGLPKFYAPMVMGLEASGQALRADAVKSKILQDVKVKMGSKSSSEEGAFYSDQHQRNRKNGGHKKGDGSCYNCKKQGHYAANCPEKQQDGSKRKGRAMCAVFAMGDNVDDEEWYFDSGATTHMARSGAEFTSKQEVSYHIGTANKSNMTANSRGSVNLECVEGPVEVQEVLEVPDLAANLLSVSKICSKGFNMTFTATDCKVLTKTGEVFASGVAEGGLYKLNRKQEKAFVCNETEKWHRRFGHISMQSMKKLMQMTNGFQLKKVDEVQCVACIQGKHARDSFPTSNTRSTELLELVHSDLCGPFEVASIGGSRYFITFIDDASRKVFIYTLESKDQVKEAYEDFKSMAERQTGKKLKILRSDNGREYVNGAMKASMRRDGVRHQKTCPYSPEQNGTAERMNRTIMERVRSMLNDAKLPKEFWAEAVNTAVYVINRSPTRALDGTTPEEAWMGRKPFVGHLKIFGSAAMVHVPKQRRKKLDPKSKRCIFLGYAEDSKGFRLYDPDTSDVIISRDIIIVDEGCCAGLEAIPSEPVEFLEIELGLPRQEEANHDVEAEAMEPEEPDQDTSIDSADFDDAVDDTALPPQQDRPTAVEQELRRSGRERHPPGKYSEYISYSSVTGQNTFPDSGEHDEDSPLDDPTSYDEVLRRPDRDQWMEAMREEIEALERNETWVMDDLPDGHKAIRNKWVYKTKRGPDGRVERYKARLVVKGCSQRPGIDFDEVYSPVVRYSTIRFLMALAVKHDLQIDQMDAVTAFLQSELGDETIFMQLPEGFTSDQVKVCRLRKALYGLKQSSRVWNKQLDAALREFGLEQSKTDTCLYFKLFGGKMLFVTIYVDDFLIFTNCRKMKKKLKRYLCSRFQMKDIGEAKFCLGLRISRNMERGELTLDQEKYVEELLEKYQMKNCHPVSTPFEPSERLDKSMCPTSTKEQEEMTKVPYKEAVGSLLYLAQATRPDISFAVNAVSQYCSNPGRRHWEAVKRILRYLKGTAGNRLVYKKDGNSQVVGYTDADWGGDPDTRKSTTGYVFVLQGGAISWSVKRQPTVALSSCEAEYMALSRTIQEALWLRNLQQPIFEEQKITILCDNQSAISIARNGSYNPRTKHVDIRYHFVHDTLEQDMIDLQYVNTNDQAADGFTKPLPPIKLVKQRQLIGITD